jgi:hypothetical protein
VCQRNQDAIPCVATVANLIPADSLQALAADALIQILKMFCKRPNHAAQLIPLVTFERNPALDNRLQTGYNLSCKFFLEGGQKALDCADVRPTTCVLSYHAQSGNLRSAKDSHVTVHTLPAGPLRLHRVRRRG